MKKIKFFLAAFAAMFGLGMQAQTWTSPGSDPVSGSTYFILNIEAGRFVTAANSWGTQMSITGTNDGLPIEAVEVNNVTVGGASLSGWELKNKNNSDKFLFRDDQNWGYTDKGSQDRGYVWNITKKDGVYRLQTATGDPAYPAAELQYAGGNNSLSDGRVYFGYNSSSRDIDWLFLTEAQKNSTNLVARAKLYRALMKAYAAGVNTDDASAVYENSESTEQQLLDQVETLDEARYQAHLANASDSDPRDITEFVLNNYDFSQMDISGWETNYVSGTQAQNIGYQSNNAFNTSSAFCNRFIEAWISSSSSIGDGYLRQTVSGLPEGKYKLECDAIAVNQSNASGTTTGTLLFITADGSDYTTSLSTGDNTPEHFSTQFLFTGEGNITFGLKTVNTTANWIAADNFKVTFYGIDLSAYATQLASEVSSFEGYENDIEATVYANLQTQVNALNQTYDTSKAYAEAIANMQIINAYVAAYAAATTAKASNGNVTGTELTELNAAIADVPTFNDYDTYAAKTSSLTTKTSTFIAAAPSYDAYVSAIAAAADEKAKADALSTSIYTTALGSTPNTAEEAAAKAASLINDIKVGEYNYVVGNYTTAIELGAWTISNAGNMTGQHWDGTGTTPYNEQKDGLWQSNTVWETSYIQEVTLPEGEYVFKVAGRHSQNSTLTLSVTSGETELGSISDFPVGDTGRGINTSGATDFATGEGHTYANGGNGRGWQWRYVPFTLSEETAVTISVVGANPNEEYHQWVSFCNYTVQAKPSVAASKTAYLQAVANANNVINDATYANVGGTDRSNLVAAVAETPTETVEWYDAQTALIQSYTTTFTAGVASWNTYVAKVLPAKAEADNFDDGIYEDLNLAAPATAAEAAAKASTNASAIRVATATYVGTHYPFSLTSKVGDFSTWNAVAKYTDNNGEHDDTPQTNNSQHWSGNTRDYYEQGVHGWGASKGFAATYTKIADVPVGEYVIKVAARAASGVTGSITVTGTENTVALPSEGASSRGINKSGEASWSGDNDTFANEGVGYGWQWCFLPFTVSTAGEVTITIQETTNETHKWFSLADAELLSMNDIATPVAYDENATNTIEDVDVANVTISRNIKTGFNTVCLPFALTAGQVADAFGAGTEVYAFSEESTDANDATINFNKVTAGTISANTPVLVKATAASTEQVFNGVQIVASGEAKVAGTNFDFVGTYARTTVAEGDYFIGNGALYKSAGSTDMNAFRAYIHAKTGASVRLFIDDVETGIEAINGVEAENGAIYNIAGQRLGKMQKGINIVNGKKIIK